ncbi:hypothetical protein CD149_03700 [Staphylococcus condimenti]|nr:hypothetical protein A4G25_05860 [Staphylococcus condimenti]APR61694.1 hypothetical protein BTZ13_10885 [Staphylococcus condimenti]OFP02627.1 hypothetical protein HMPREF3007_03205 [Staphylococcus sp. HMSC065E08]PNZ62024.1 hypothetical protein CD149_03700 [Staphylococcus condimenti]VEG65100.1 Uncharacterised protein [Staphylococcus condimenti]
MIWVIIILIVAVTYLTKLASNYLIQIKRLKTARLMVSVMIFVQIILVYYFVRMLNSYIINILNMFYNQ